MEMSSHRKTSGIALAAIFAVMALALLPAASHAIDNAEVVAEAAASMVDWKPDINAQSVIDRELSARSVIAFCTRIPDR